MKDIQQTLLSALQYFIATVFVATIVIVPLTIVLGCITLIMMMVGV